ncbi:MAG: acyl-CoA dehydrogenase [Actinomycetota bacterium]|nr:acyl-CoA dehydrogenase [Actinomycetota bacterium]
MTYRAPVTDMRFTLTRVVGLDRVTELDRFSHVDGDTLAGILDEAGRFMSEVVAPLGPVGDAVGSVLADDGGVATPPGYREAYRKFVEAGWPAAALPQEWGGGGLPWAIGAALQEMLTAADMAFSLCPMLTHSANDMLLQHASDEQQATYLGKLVSGEWTGTMALTEPHAGSDVGALSMRAERVADGTYRLSGTKIFITWGDHDLTDNIVHIVLARTPGAPTGTKGISCFIVPKFLVGPDGSPAQRNDLTTVSLEHKVGIHASPTCVLAFGERGEGAIGYLIGEENEGMRFMFTMMNSARLQVGLEGLAVAERAYQRAVAHATERTQGRAVGDDRVPSPILRHPDVRRMLMLMRSQVEAMRCVMYRNALAIDLSTHHPAEAVRDAEADIAGILTPVSKAWGTDLGVEIASLGIQVHGGMGYVEETGAAQLWRDSRIAPIYEGTNGIQAIDLVTRKLPLAGGDAIRGLLAEAGREADGLEGDLSPIGQHLTDAVDATGKATEALLDALEERLPDALAGATPYTRMLGTTLGGALLARSARIAAEGAEGFSSGFLAAKAATARFYADQVLSQVPGMLPAVLAGAESTFGVPEEALRRS